MNTVALRIEGVDEQTAEILMAFLDEYDAFEHKSKVLYAYIAEQKYDSVKVDETLKDYDLKYSIEILAEQNWNSTWEQSYEPVIVGDFCTVRATFHEIEVSTLYDIIITPQMSFGTGHHATTRLMIQMMRDIEMKNRHVLDFGTGTGVLAILAEKIGATAVYAIDNDEWSYRNAVENVDANDCKYILVEQDVLDNLSGSYHVVLANINRQILVKYMEQMAELMKKDGTLLLSGILLEDENIIRKKAEASGFSYEDKAEEGNWLCMKFIKN